MEALTTCKCRASRPSYSHRLRVCRPPVRYLLVRRRPDCRLPVRGGLGYVFGHGNRGWLRVLAAPYLIPYGEYNACWVKIYILLLLLKVYTRSGLFTRFIEKQESAVQTHKNTVRQISIRVRGEETVDQDNEEVNISETDHILPRFAEHCC